MTESTSMSSTCLTFCSPSFCRPSIAGHGCFSGSSPSASKMRLQVLDLLLRLGVVLLQIALQRGVGRFVLKIFEHLQDRLLHRQSRAELVHEQFGRRLDLGHTTSLSGSELGKRGLPAAGRAKRPRCAICGLVAVAAAVAADVEILTGIPRTAAGA